MSNADESAAPQERINPFLFIWLNPRGAMRSDLNRGHRRRLWVFLGVLALAQVVIKLSASDESLLFKALTAVGVATVYTAAIYHIYARLLNWVCHSLNGLGELPESRAALVWIEYVRTGAALLMLIALTVARSASDNHPVTVHEDPAVVLVTYGLGFALFIYEVAISSMLIAEAHEFAWWKGLLSAFLTRILLGILLFVAMLPFGIALALMGV